jgi:hypothetical protein
MSREPNIQDWMHKRIRTIARGIAEDDPMMKAPHWSEVRAVLQNYLDKTPHWADKTQMLSAYFKTPGRTAIETRIKDDGKLYSWSNDDQDWSLGLHTASGLTDDSAGVCMEIWQWTLRQANHAPFSVRTAKWVSKLRWVVEAGGSPIGRVGHPENLYILATQYAAHERHVEAVNDSRGMRSPVLDAGIMLSKDEKAVAERLGLMAEWGASDDHIALGLAFQEMAPEVFDQMQKQGQVRRGVLDISGPTAMTNKLLETYGPEGAQRRVEIEGMWAMALRVAMRHPLFEGLPQKARFHFNVGLLLNLCETDEHGEAGSWNPEFERLIDEAIKATDEPLDA